MSTLSPGGPENSFAYAYCHGFLSGPASVKGQALRKTLLETGVELNLLNLNGVEDDHGSITCSGAVQAVRAFHLDRKSVSGDPGLKLRLVGSSLGGFISARSSCVINYTYRTYLFFFEILRVSLPSVLRSEKLSDHEAVVSAVFFPRI